MEKGVVIGGVLISVSFVLATLLNHSATTDADASMQPCAAPAGEPVNEPHLWDGKEGHRVVDSSATIPAGATTGAHRETPESDADDQQGCRR